MPLNAQQCVTQIVNAVRPVVKIDGFTSREWYRKPAGGRRGPWLQGVVEILDMDLWNEKVACLYFLLDSKRNIKYVGISVNQLKDRWRMSPAYDVNQQPLNRKEMFHSQCWPHMCRIEKEGYSEAYTVVVLHDNELLKVLSQLNNEINSLSFMKEDPDIAVIAMEVWFIKRFGQTLWNKRK